MTQYQMMKKLADAKAKIEFVEHALKEISEYFMSMIQEVKAKINELEQKLEDMKREQKKS